MKPPRPRGLRRAGLAAIWLLWPAISTAAAPQLTAQERALIAEALQDGDDLADAPSRQLGDEGLWAALLRRATREFGLRIQPSSVDRLWAIAPRARSVEAELREARAQGRLAPWLQDLGPRTVEQRVLASARRRYRRIVDNGGWRPIAEARSVRPGDTAPEVAELRTRLAAEGYLPGPASPRFDPALEAALRQFQHDHDLATDGVLGPATRAELNSPAEDRLAQLDANLERWRWMPALPPDRLEVDVVGAEAVLYSRGAPRLQMRFIVGAPRHKTPMFASQLQAVIFNPPWNVPASIASAEILPKARTDPGYLARNGFTFVDGRLQQRPGPLNALGQLKFDLPSPFGVYLHDTPARSAFNRNPRTLSHGCIRLERPRELAAALLADQAWTADRIDAAIAGGATLRTPLSRPFPLYVLYWTVKVEPTGGVMFRRDPYGWDARLNRALAGRAPGPIETATARDNEWAAANPPQDAL